MYYIVALERGEKKMKKGYLSPNHGFTKDITKAEIFLSLEEVKIRLNHRNDNNTIPTNKGNFFIASINEIEIEVKNKIDIKEL